jgi:zinc/manganese transport system ATP-binding protein/zinc transport system ATP-binding protein
VPAPLIDIRDLSVSYDHEPLWKALNLTIMPSQFTALVGPTGCGKSTLLKAILGLVACPSGTVQRREGLTIGYVPQHASISWQFPVTVEQVVRMGRYRRTTWWPWASREDRRQSSLLLDRLGLAAYAQRHISDLSGGQQQRVFLARALIGTPQLLLLDEPTAGVDMKTQHDVLHLLRELNGEGMTILLTTHDLNTIASHVPWVICFNRRIVAQGPPAAVLTPAILRQTYDAQMTVVSHDGMTFIANRSLVHRHADKLARPRSAQRRAVDGTAS